MHVAGGAWRRGAARAAFLAASDAATHGEGGAPGEAGPLSSYMSAILIEFAVFNSLFYLLQTVFVFFLSPASVCN